MKEKLRSFYKTYNVFIHFCIVFLLIICYGLDRNIMAGDYWHDSLEYYKASRTFVADGKFALVNYMDYIRGYFFPFLLYVYSAVGQLAGLEDGMAILIANSLAASAVFALILPSLFRDRKNNLICIMTPVVLFLAYWQDLIYYPLSDFYAFALILLSVFFLIKVREHEENKLAGFFLCVLSGICLYGAYNTRTIYLFGVPFIVALFFFFNRKRGRKRLISYLLFLLTGILICAAPQSRINQKMHGSRSIAVITSSMEGGSLFNFQLSSGINMQRYETYVGSEDGYPKHKFIFEDEAGKQIMREEGKTLFSSIGEYLKVAVKYPLDFAGIYTRHLFNAFCTPYNHVYVKYLHAFKPWLILLNYTLVFIAGMGIILQKSYRLHMEDEANLYMLFSLMPCAMILPGAIEMRFFAPMYILLYGYLAYKINYGLLYSYMKKHPIKILCVYAGILCICLSIWGSTLASAECGAQLFR